MTGAPNNDGVAVLVVVVPPNENGAIDGGLEVPRMEEVVGWPACFGKLKVKAGVVAGLAVPPNRLPVPPPKILLVFWAKGAVIMGLKSEFVLF